MNKFSMRLFSILLAISVVFSSASLAFAESPPFQPEGLTTTVSGNVDDLDATISWNSIPNQEGSSVLYAIRVWSDDVLDYDQASDTNKWSKEGLSETSYVMSVKEKTTYRYQLGYAYDNSTDPIEYNYSEVSELIIPDYKSSTLSSPLKVNFRKAAGTYGEKKLSDDWVIVSWGSSSAFSKYELYRGTKKLADVTGSTSYTDKKVPKGTYSYIIRAYYKDSSIYRDFVSNEINVSYHITNAIKSNVVWSAVAKKKTIKIYNNKTGSKYYYKVKKGTSLSATGGKYPDKIPFWETPTRVEVKYNGKTGWVKWSDIKMKYGRDKNDYSISTKEDYVNSIGLSSSTKYLIWVSRYTQTVNVFTGSKGKWILKKSFVCSTGNYYQPTKGGTKYIKSHKSKVTKVHKNGRLYYFLYSTSFGGSGTFHTRCKWTSNNKWRNKVKQNPTTKGCVRLFDDPAKYIYSLPLNTTVFIR